MDYEVFTFGENLRIRAELCGGYGSSFTLYRDLATKSVGKWHLRQTCFCLRIHHQQSLLIHCMHHCYLEELFISFGC